MDNNVYVSLSELKTMLKRTDTSEDDTLLLLARRASRLIDNYCDRKFYVAVATKSFEGKGSPTLFVSDLIDPSSITIDGVVFTNYELRPWNEYPKTSIRSGAGAFTIGAVVEVIGKWGYDEIKEDSLDAVVNDDDLTEGVGIDATNTSLEVDYGTRFSVGEMLLIDDEQVYVSVITDDVLTIIRAQNGTTAAEHIQTTPIYILRAPDPIVQACVMQTIRFYRGRDAAFSGVSGSEATLVFKEPALEVRVLLNPYKRYHFGE